MAFSLKQLSLPAAEPIALADMKAHLSVDPGFTDDDLLIAGMISAARQDAENYLGQALVLSQWLFALDCFPAYRIMDAAPSRSDFDALGNYNFDGWRWLSSQTIALPRSPLVSVDSLQYVDLSTGVLTTLNPSLYQVDTISEPGRVLPSVGGYWPATAAAANAVQIKFTAGRLRSVLDTFTVPAAPYAVTLSQGANFYSLLSIVDSGTGQPVSAGLYSIAAGVVTFNPSLAGHSIQIDYNFVSISPTTLMAIKLRAAAYYANREEFVAGQNTVLPDWFERMLTGVGRSNIFGYVGR